METTEILITCEDGDTDPLLANLMGRVFHLTPTASYDAIRRTGKVLHNRDGNYELNTSSQFSYGRMNGYVCLFDLRENNEKILEEIKFRYPLLYPSWFSIEKDGWDITEVTYLLLNPGYYSAIIPNSAAPPPTEHCKHIRPGEVWIEDHIPLEWIDTVILATRRHPAHQTLLKSAHENLFKPQSQDPIPLPIENYETDLSETSSI